MCGGIGIPVASSRAPGTCTYRCVRPVLVLLYLNLPQVPLASKAGVSQVPARTHVIARALQASAPAVKGHSPDLYSGRHRTTGLDIQVTCTLSDQPGPDRGHRRHQGQRPARPPAVDPPRRCTGLGMPPRSEPPDRHLSRADSATEQNRAHPPTTTGPGGPRTSTSTALSAPPTTPRQQSSDSPTKYK